MEKITIEIGNIVINICRTTPVLIVYYIKALRFLHGKIAQMQWSYSLIKARQNLFGIGRQQTNFPRSFNQTILGHQGRLFQVTEWND
jgi:hypothetical protein